MLYQLPVRKFESIAYNLNQNILNCVITIDNVKGQAHCFLTYICMLEPFEASGVWGIEIFLFTLTNFDRITVADCLLLHFF